MIRLPTADGLALIQRWEGFRHSPYQDSVGVWTIGYGTTVYPDGRRVGPQDPMVGEELASAYLLDHVARLACPSVLRLITVPLSDGQYDALVSFVYNLGGGALQASQLRQCVIRREDEKAAEQFGRWIWAGGRKLKGLVARRRAEAIMYLS
mgnify:CR=1 FL=1